ncbi:TPA: hypothetical protein DCW38_07855 [candidate division WOR-3 bacterium]|jgi:hypothetical protein|uniref:Uncharacterized protein n=1 Tax=candidate division WOR-3 bacterium TaxID=2052148 RepID=A0A350HC09_UNCW3|nr:hypothetical protein [candidate division WOR-3 bacterium]
MKFNSSILFFVILSISIGFIFGCYVIPKNIPIIENITYSIPLGDTILTALEVSESYSNRDTIRGDTIFVRTVTTSWIRAVKDSKDTIRITIDIEELLPEEIIDTNSDSTYFTSTVDKVENYVRFWGNVPYTTGLHLLHSMYSDGQLIYMDTVDVFLMQTDSLDTTYQYIAYDFPFGEYYHLIEMVIDSGQTVIDSVQAYSLIACKFHLTGDRVMTVIKEQELPFTPPEDSPLRMINWVRINLNIWNRVPFSSNLILFLIDSMDNVVLNDTFLLNCVDKDTLGMGIGEGAYSNFNLHLDEGLEDLFRYSTIKAKARLEIPKPDDPKVFITPEDYIRVQGAIQINVDYDYTKIPVGSESNNTLIGDK